MAGFRRLGINAGIYSLAAILTQAIAFSAFAVPDVWPDQDEPPFAVTRIVPAAPTAQQCVESGQLMSFRLFVVPEVCADHDEPPFAVVRISPDVPTTQQMLEVGHTISESVDAVPDV